MRKIVAYSIYLSVILLLSPVLVPITLFRWSIETVEGQTDKAYWTWLKDIVE